MPCQAVSPVLLLADFKTINSYNCPDRAVFFNNNSLTITTHSDLQPDKKKRPMNLRGFARSMLKQRP